MLPRRTPSEWLSSLPTLLVLLMAILMATGETLHSRLLQIGQHTWDDYFRLRVADQRPEPLCADVQTFEAQVQAALAAQQAQAAADPFADLLGDGASEADVRRSLEAALQQCQQQRSAWLSEQARVTPGLAAYRQLEAGVALVVAWTGNHRRFMLAALLVLCAAMAALHRHHIALRPIQSVRDYRVATGAQLLANALLTLSAVVYRAQEAHSQQQGVEVAFFYLHHLWIAGFSGLTLVSAWQLWKTPADLDAGGHWGRALLSIPLYNLMCISAAVQFAWHGFYHGISVYLSMMAELSSLFLNLALYVWVGMLLTRTRLAIRVFDVLRPWQLSPPLLCTVVLLIAALPTAYTGASGIFIMAAGVTLYQELRRGGVSEPLALATTAMSGSMGVVLRPCLLVVIVATLNNTVTTQELFTAGVKVFLLSLVLFLLVALLLRESGTRPMASPREALPAS
ncbi:MAG: C4-dicarboxylate ABC transporter, partial [Gammaproteobacteria bacterium]|nr:C4-dicarboxylate ABC transporter [Gammaproteobacteria bacterium]